MGLDTSHDCWHGAYSGFRRLRNAVARAANWPMTDDDTDYVLPDDLPIDVYQGDWDRIPGDDPLIVFLAHSDCDGVIHPQHGIHVAGRLRQLAPLLPDIGEGHVTSYRGDAIQFAEGLERAAALGEDVVFS